MHIIKIDERIDMAWIGAASLAMISGTLSERKLILSIQTSSKHWPSSQMMATNIQVNRSSKMIFEDKNFFPINDCAITSTTKRTKSTTSRKMINCQMLLITVFARTRERERERQSCRSQHVSSSVLLPSSTPFNAQRRGMSNGKTGADSHHCLKRIFHTFGVHFF